VCFELSLMDILNINCIELFERCLFNGVGNLLKGMLSLHVFFFWLLITTEVQISFCSPRGHLLASIS
jgi:hypothetical protein